MTRVRTTLMRVLTAPLRGVQEWDRPGQALHAPEAHRIFLDELRSRVREPVRLVELDAHINDEAFSAGVLAIFDDWVARGVIRPGKAGEP